VLQNTEGGDTDSEDEADRLEEVESYLRVYDPDFKTSVAPSALSNLQDSTTTTATTTTTTKYYYYYFLSLISYHLEFHPTIRQRGSVHRHFQASPKIILFYFPRLLISPT